MGPQSKRPERQAKTIENSTQRSSSLHLPLHKSAPETPSGDYICAGCNNLLAEGEGRFCEHKDCPSVIFCTTCAASKAAKAKVGCVHKLKKSSILNADRQTANPKTAVNRGRGQLMTAKASVSSAARPSTTDDLRTQAQDQPQAQESPPAAADTDVVPALSAEVLGYPLSLHHLERAHTFLLRAHTTTTTTNRPLLHLQGHEASARSVKHLAGIADYKLTHYTHGKDSQIRAARNNSQSYGFIYDIITTESRAAAPGAMTQPATHKALAKDGVTELTVAERRKVLPVVMAQAMKNVAVVVNDEERRGETGCEVDDIFTLAEELGVDTRPWIASMQAVVDAGLAELAGSGKEGMEGMEDVGRDAEPGDERMEDREVGEQNGSKEAKRSGRRRSERIREAVERDEE
ncbi:hypothetical protein LTR62_008090 [Meristemomyces frigidus]|uniref:Uncharacterized protein n=1 Tax=Meristemomyces frigidus TaxID=1508187 RepID=A0AAN7TBB2_9PEZI|nr:hypothetical protein LTR62_008090 [Meristemomyces frigidus]